MLLNWVFCHVLVYFNRSGSSWRSTEAISKHTWRYLRAFLGCEFKFSVLLYFHSRTSSYFQHLEASDAGGQTIFPCLTKNVILNKCAMHQNQNCTFWTEFEQNIGGTKCITSPQLKIFWGKSPFPLKWGTCSNFIKL